MTPDISNSPTKRTELVRIGLARDRAFCFYYPDNLEILERFGADLVPFSPLKEIELPSDIDGLYLGGGYPELSAKELSENETLRKKIFEKVMEGMPVFGECGGFMYLCDSLIDHGDNVFPMVGCFPFRTRLYPGLKSLGYREITLISPSILGDPGLKARGHEFHYSAITEHSPENDYSKMFSVTPRKGIGDKRETGFQVRRCLGSYIHLHFGSQPVVAENFTNICREYQSEKKGKL